jgi:hypothetical protein
MQYTRIWGHVALAGLLGAPLGLAADPHSTELVNHCASRATAFLESLGSDQRALAGQPFDEAKRRIWSYGPNVLPFTLRAEGVALKDMSAAQRITAHRLLECGLSSQGYQKTTAIMALDNILAQTDLYRSDDPDNQPPFGSSHYWLAVFGEPGGTEPWGWQYEGHHLTLNFTVVDNEILYAPTFMGADPAEVQDGDRAGWRILGSEVDKGLLLINSMTAKQRDQAILADEIPPNASTGRPGKGDALTDYEGLPVAQLDADQLLLFWSLVEEYVGNSNDVIARAHYAAIQADGAQNLYFAWMGPTTAGSGIYYRIHGPSLLVEFVTARNRQSSTLEPNPNHVHTIFRYPGKDFGDDPLQRHYANSPHHQDP